MLPMGQMKNPKLVDAVPEAGVSGDPPAEIPNDDVLVRDAVQIDDQLEVAPIENEPVAVRQDNMPWRSKRIENKNRCISLISMNKYGDNLEEPKLKRRAFIQGDSPVKKSSGRRIFIFNWKCDMDASTKSKPNKMQIDLQNQTISQWSRNKIQSSYVAKGYSQIRGIDYNETFAPVVKHTSLWLILAIATSKEDLNMLQLDIKTVFLYGDLEENLGLYKEQPEGYVNEDQANYVWKLKKMRIRPKAGTEGLE